MALKNYYDGEGDKVMRNMKQTYGPKKAESVFYATANKQKGAKPSGGARGVFKSYRAKVRGAMREE